MQNFTNPVIIQEFKNHYPKLIIGILLIILMNNTFKVISYEDVIWLYPFEQKVNGIKSSKSIMVVTNDGKTSNIVTVPAITKGRMEMFDEIFNTIANKNDETLIGYTSENAKIIKEQIKLNKENK